MVILRYNLHNIFSILATIITVVIILKSKSKPKANKDKQEYFTSPFILSLMLLSIFLCGLVLVMLSGIPIIYSTATGFEALKLYFMYVGLIGLPLWIGSLLYIIIFMISGEKNKVSKISILISIIILISNIFNLITSIIFGLLERL